MKPEPIPFAFDAEARRAQMFPTLTPADVRRLAPHGAEVSFENDQLVFERGDVNVPFYVVIEGELAIVHPMRDREDPITIHRAGQFTGEASVIAGRPSLVRGRAVGHLRALRIDHARFMSLLQTDSDLSEVVMRAYILRRLGLLTGDYPDVVVIGSRHSAATLRVQQFLMRNGHPYQYVDVERESEVEQLLGAARYDVGDIPIVIWADRKTLRNPSDAEIAECLGLNAPFEPGAIHDVVICGAGPAGLAAAVYAASEGLDVLLVESSAPGGQAATSSKIENYLGFPTGVSGQALAGRALAQAEKFGARIAVARGAVGMSCRDRLVDVDLANGESLRTRAVVIATGAEYRKLDVPDRARFEGVGIYYAATFMEAQRCSSSEVVVVGGGNSAGQAATFLAGKTAHVHMLIRGEGLAASMSRYLIRRIEETPNITLHRRTQIVAFHGDEQLEGVTWRDATTGRESTHKIRHVFTMAGAAPNTAWIRDRIALDDHGFVRTDIDLTDEILRERHWPLARRPHLFETSHPHVFAIGDVRANNVKRVASAVGEGSVCIQLIHRALAE